MTRQTDQLPFYYDWFPCRKHKQEDSESKKLYPVFDGNGRYMVCPGDLRPTHENFVSGPFASWSDAQAWIDRQVNSE